MRNHKGEVPGSFLSWTVTLEADDYWKWVMVVFILWDGSAESCIDLWVAMVLVVGREEIYCCWGRIAIVF